LTARTGLGQFREKEWLDVPSYFGLSPLPTTNLEYTKKEVMISVKKIAP